MLDNLTRASVLIEAKLKLDPDPILSQALDLINGTTKAARAPKHQRAFSVPATPSKPRVGRKYPTLDVGEQALIKRAKHERHAGFQKRLNAFIIRMRAAGEFYNWMPTKKGALLTRVATREESYRARAD